MFHFEHRHQRLATLGQFLWRLAGNALVAAVLIALSLGLGMAGYRHFEGMSPTDAFLNAAMILSGMGPVGPLQSEAGKVFAGCYALYSGIVLVFATGILLAPMLHRVLHGFHLETEEEGIGAAAVRRGRD